MITTADALDVMTVVTACHHRTAPRMDDNQATMATATVWAELFNAHRLAVADLVAAVKHRAAFHADAPEPAEIITFAREIRRKRDADAGPTPAYEALCESKAADADELAANRRIRETSPAVERPRLAELVAAIAHGKAVAK
jgi:hypothetical protein